MASTASQATKAMTKLSLEPTPQRPSSSKTKPKPKKKAVADSWEDEESSTSEAEDEPPTPSTQPDSTAQGGVAAPPPTPVSPSYGRLEPNEDGDNSAPWLPSSSTDGSYGYRDAQNDGAVRRPEKTDAVARRMIASALGVRAPKATEEQKAYDRALREKERKRREAEREAERKRKEEAEKAKAAIWED